MTLESQYKRFLLENPDSELTYEEWLKEPYIFKFRNIPEGFEPTVSDDFMIGPDGAFEYNEDDFKDWDTTLMDGLENEPYE